MKFKITDLMVIKGGAVAAPDFNSDKPLRPLAHHDRQEGGVPAMLITASEGIAADDTQPTQGPDVANHPSAVGQGAAVAQWVWAASLDVWTPLFRSTDSACLLGQGGVLKVGVNDLGWVVYDWIPGP